MNQEQTFLFNLSFLNQKVSENIAINYQNESITYGSLWSKVSETSLKLNKLNGRLVLVDFQNPIEHIIYFLAVIEAGGNVLVCKTKELFEEDFGLEKLSDENIFLFTDNTQLLSLENKNVITRLYINAIENGKDDIYNKGGIIIASTQEAYYLNLETIQSHIESVTTSFGLRDTENVFAYEKDLRIDVLELLLPVINSNATLNIINKTIKEFSDTSGILKINKEKLNEEIDLLKIKSYDFSTIILSSHLRITESTVYQLQNVFNFKELIVTYQLENIMLSVIQSNITEKLTKSNIESIAYTKPFGKSNVQILDKKKRIPAIKVPGTLWFESKCISNPIGQNKLVEVFNIGSANRTLRALDYRASFEGDKSIVLLNNAKREINITSKLIALDITEEYLNNHPSIKESYLIHKKTKDQIVAFVVFKENEITDPSTLRNWLKKFVNSKNLPSVISVLVELPKNVFNEIDYTALNQLHIDFSKKVNLTSNQQQLITIWEEILEVKGIELEDNFFELGGHSLLATRLVSMIRTKMDIEIPITTIFLYPTVVLLSDELSSNLNKIVLPQIIIQDKPTTIPLSFSQQRLWFLDKFQGTQDYHISGGLKLKGEVDFTLVETTLKIIIERHEILRTVINEKDGIGYQKTLATKTWELSKNNTQEGISDQELISNYAEKSFDLAKDYMFRACLNDLGENTYLLVCVFHHIASDGWSIQVFIEEFVKIYTGLQETKETTLAQLPIQYADYAIWQKTHIKGQLLDDQLTYWKEKLANVTPLSLITDVERSKIQGTEGASLEVFINPALVNKLRILSSSNGCSLYMVLLAGFKILLHKYSRQEDICVGTPISGRTQQNLEGLIGFFVNTLAMRSNVNSTMSFEDFLQRVRSTALEAYKNQDAPFEKVIEVTRTNRDLNKNPLLQVMFSLENTGQIQDLITGDFQVDLIKPTKLHMQSDLHFLLEEDVKRGIALEIQYREELFDTTAIKKLARHYEALLVAILENPYQKIGKLKMLQNEEVNQLLNTFNTTKIAFNKEETVLDTFTNQTAKNPNSIALIHGETALTYKELDIQSNQIAYLLKENGIRKNDLVPICMERSILTVVSIFGILKSGAAYIPIDHTNPIDRIAFIIDDTSAKLVITSSDIEKKLKEGSTVNYIIIDTLKEDLLKKSSKKLDITITQSDLAYIIYTSGTTGFPKGAMIEHKALNSFIEFTNHTHPLSKGEHMAFKTNYGFDMAIPEIFGWIKGCASMVIISDNEVKDPAQFLKILSKQKVTQLNLVPSYLPILLDEVYKTKETLPALRHLLVGGEVLPVKTVQRYQDSGLSAILDNIYGPTEASVFSTYYSVNNLPKNAQFVPIGKPTPNAQVYILGDNLELLPTGVVGELCIGGLGLGRGYINREELTSQKFISNPYKEGERLYLTGDLAKWSSDGVVIYAGRKDDQVKIRGYRIELGEIETVLNKCIDVKQSVVITKTFNGSDKQLVAYLITETQKNIDTEILKENLLAKLPEYMVPSFFVFMNSFPLSQNGKIDKKQLPDPDKSLLLSKTFIAPRNEQENKLAEIWKQLLSLEKIGIHDNFFELGGHSLLATQVVSKVRKELNIEISIRSIFIYPTIELLSEKVLLISKKPTLPAIISQEKSTLIPLSYGQQGMWFLDKLQGTREYHVSGGLRLIGTVDFKILETALKTIINRHEVLRTVIKEKNGIGYQEIVSIDKWKLSTIKIEESDNEKEEISKFLNIPFDLSNDYMFRACLYNLGNDKNILACVFHHIASDGWSLPIFINEFTEVYKTLKRDQEIALPKLPLQYSDFAIWQRNNIQGAFLENQLSYWENKLNGVIPLSLPTDFVRPSIQSTKGAHIYFELDKSLKDSLNAICKEQEVTLFMLLLSAFKVLLHKYSGQNDICIGTPIANRNQTDLEKMIGYFVNTLALRSNVDQSLSFQEFLQQVKETTLESYEYQHAPFDKIVERIIGNRDTSITQVFQVMFDLRNIVELKELTIDDLKLTPYAFEEDTAQFDLNFSAEEHKEGISFDMEYCTDLFERVTVERMLNHFEELLRSISIDYTQTLSSLKILTPKEKQQLLYSFNDTDVAYPLDLTVIDLFKKQVEQTPNNIALSFRGEKITYKELDEKSNQIANYLIEQGVKEDDLIGICLERSFSLVVGVLSILKSGGAYVPIKPDYPESRINHILEDIDCSILLTDTFSKKILDKISLKNTQLLVLNSKNPDFKNYSTIEIEKVYNSNSLAYVIYTSGSTGKPKGALIEHKGLLNHLLLMIDELQLNNETSIAFTAPFTFDISVWQILTSLLVGGKTAIYKEQDLLETNAFINSLTEEKVTILQLVPSYTSSLLETTSSKKLEELNYLLVTGEAVTKDILDRWFEAYSSVRVVNAYGPAEASDDVSLHIMKVAPKEGLVPIGKPVANTKIYIVDSSGNPCPLGVTGELWIGGIGVGRGYLNLEKLTETKFTKNPFTENGRIYKTGDLGRWLSNGTIEFVGREDDQVKVRGHRIELGEIENILSSIPKVISCCVLVKEDEKGNKNLVGYTVSDNSLDNELFQEALKSKLPEYMVPRLWVKLEEMPLTPNGKIDKKALQKIKPNSQPTKNYEVAQTTTEKHLTKIWKELLGAEKIGINDNFFELGGHSLLATRLVSTIRKEMNVEIPIQLIFTHPIIALLSKELLLNSEEVVISPITLQDKPTKIPLSFSQERLWFVDQLQGSLGYHMSGRLELNGNVSIPMIEESFKKLVERHQTLRTIIIKSEEGLGYQKTISSDYWKLNVSEKTSQEEIEKDILIFSDTPFILSEDYMLRARIYNTGTNQYTLTILIHHIASDGWSEGILINELVSIYNALHKNEEVQLPLLSLQYADYAIWQRQILTNEVLNEQLMYWENSLKGVLPLALPKDYPRPSVQDISGSFIRFELKKELTKNLSSLCKEEGVTLFMFLLSTFKVLLFKYSGQKDICVGTPIANRTQSDIEDMVGFFVNTLALRTDLSGNPSFKELLNRVKATTLGGQGHQLTPFEKVVDKVVKIRDMSINPLFQVLFVLDNTPRVSDFSLDDLDVSLLDNENPSSKFDITLRVEENKDVISFDFEYCTALFKEDTIHQMVQHYQELLKEAIKNVHQPIGALKMLTTNETAKIINTVNDTAVFFEKSNQTIDQLFSNQAKLHPNETCLVDENQRLSLKEVDELSTTLASHILDNGVTDTLIAIYMEPSVEVIIAMLAIFKSGSAYLPIDTELPSERIQHIIKDSGVKWMISNSKYINNIPFEGTAINVENKSSWTYNKRISKSLNNPGKLAYVIYTSGSTGKPKGVKISQLQLVNYVQWFTKTLNYSNKDNSILLSSFAFDLGHSAIFPTIANGGTLHLLKKERYLNINYLNTYLAEEKITFIKGTPTLFSLIINDSNFDLESLSELNHLMLGGESIIYNDLTTFFNYYPNKKVINHYGPTEATIGCIIKPLCKDNYHEVKNNSIIGRPISNMKTYILDDYFNPVAPGVLGQLYLSGLGVSKGYYKHPELNEGKFINNPFVKEERMYATGDLASWSSDNEIIFKGRLDDQLKIRGYRVELGEIENVLLNYSSVLNSCVLAKEDSTENNRLIGYIVIEGSFDKEKLEVFLSNYLPDYMIPRIWVELKEMPFTNNGKVNKKELPEPDIGLSSAEYAAPRNELEELLVSIWQQLLNIEKIGVSDNFFELGGDSITAIQVSSYLYKKQYKVEIRDIMRFSTIKEVVPFIKPLNRIAEQGLISGNVALTPIQKAFFELEKKETNYYNQSVIISSQNRIDTNILEETLAVILRWHDALRTTYKIEDGSITQTTQGDIIPVSLKIYDLPTVTNIDGFKKEAIEVQSNISLENGPLMRAAIFKTKEIDYILIAIHHLVIDVVSWRIFLEDFYNTLKQLKLNEKIVLPIKTDSFKLWSEEIEHFIKSPKFDQERFFWNKRITESTHTHILYDFNQSDKAQVNNRTDVTITLEQEYVSLLETEGHKAFNTEINDILLAALSESVYREFSLEETAVMLESHGRAELNEALSFNRTVGWFTSAYPVYLPSTSKKPLNSVIKDIKEHLHQIPNNGIGFGLLRYKDESEIANDIKTIPLPQIIFNYLGNIDGMEENGSFKLVDNHLNIDESSKNESNYPIEFLGYMKNGALEFSLSYHTTHFKEQTIKKWLETYKTTLKEIIDFCINQEHTEATPSDYDYTDLSSDDLVELNDLF
ncbi:non-ribosomal peptide synthetase [Tenacibaculum ovolyticum]|uniref:non-ribosomal peptide synthetase n=1 Tax=Tenacibaculum ovolyticum TaxID=104270 RepID=UPI000401AA5B|nr:non-ribosomal peptide synthetase [Tenacibaculum ovolyticum]